EVAAVEALASAPPASAAPAAAAPAPAPAGSHGDVLPEDADEEIIGVFLEEADELLEALDESIDAWSDETENRLHLENLLRTLHTLKGGARLSGLARLGNCAHELESYLIDFQERNAPAEPALFAELHTRYDEIAHLVATTRALLAGETPPEPPATASPPAETPAPEPGPEPAREAAEAATAAETPAETPAPVPEVAPEAPVSADDGAPANGAPAAAETAPNRARQTQEMVRVGADLLESLVNLAGESSIIRARVEQGMSDFSGALDEMETTIERLREQLRRLEIETEAQILFRHDRPERPAYEDFDPLEMDRYSQLQQLSRALTESASDMLDLKDTLVHKARDAETLLLQQARVNTELQEGLMRSRMVPFGRLVPRLRRTVRQVAKELGKEVELDPVNVDGELDRTLLERMLPPLEHMLRNAVDHGIEPGDERRRRGKAERGRIEIRLSREGGDVVIEISDDGGGIDVERVRAKAVERGLMDPDADLDDDEISEFVLAPGFSTAASVTQISGRGVGMDVVHSEVKQLGGSIGITSERGKGTRFVVRVPFTVSVNRALMVSVGDDLYAIPLNTIEGIVLLSPEDLERMSRPDGEPFEYAGVPYRIQYLGDYLGRDFRPQPAAPGSVPVVLVRAGAHAVAVHVDAVQGSREIVVKSLGPQFAGVGGISGATILGDGSVVVILDLLALIRAQSAGKAEAKRTVSGAPRTRCVMVVDDSVTVRKVTSRLLERQGMDVLVAKDGVEAVSLLQERRPDVMLLDIEMPRMDGFEVLRQVRHDERMRGLPVVMISSRTGTKHKERAAELNVSRFLGKPFQENELLSTIDELVTGGGAS
ncbi:MAG: response regulator, partial [Pseudomonadota bacterium]